MRDNVAVCRPRVSTCSRTSAVARAGGVLAACCWLLLPYSVLATGPAAEAAPLPTSFEALLKEQLTLHAMYEKTLSILSTERDKALASSRTSNRASSEAQQAQRRSTSEYRKLRMLVRRLRQHYWLQQGLTQHLLQSAKDGERLIATASYSADTLSRTHAREKVEAWLFGAGVGIAVGAAGTLLTIVLLSR